MASTAITNAQAGVDAGSIRNAYDLRLCCYDMRIRVFHDATHNRVDALTTPGLKLFDSIESAVTARSVPPLAFFVCLSGKCHYLSHAMRKPDFAYAKTKPQISCAVAAQLINRLCFRYTDSTIPLLPKSEISETPKTGCLTSQVIL